MICLIFVLKTPLTLHVQAIRQLLRIIVHGIGEHLCDRFLNKMQFDGILEKRAHFDTGRR